MKIFPLIFLEILGILSKYIFIEIHRFKSLSNTNNTQFEQIYFYIFCSSEQKELYLLLEIQIREAI